MRHHANRANKVKKPPHLTVAYNVSNGLNFLFFFFHINTEKSLTTIQQHHDNLPVF